jgi:multiple sugar transport system substrate-binding protein
VIRNRRLRQFLLLLVLLLTAATTLWVLLLRDPELTDETTLTYWTHTDPNRTELEQRLIARFSEAEIARTTYGSQEISELVLTAFAAGRGPDIFNLQIENAHTYISTGQVVPIDPRTIGFDTVEDIAGEYVDGVLDPVMHDGKLYGLPLELTNWAIYLNRELFREAGLDPDADYPRTWQDMVRVSERIVRREDGRLLRRGFDFRYSDYLIGIVPMVEQLGGQLVSADGTQAIVGEEAWLEFLHFFQEWGPAGRNLGAPTYENARSLFNANADEVAMAHSGLYQQGRIKAENPEFYESGDWMVIPYPVFENASHHVSSSYYGHYLMVSADTPVHLQDDAWRFVWFLLEHAEEYLELVNIVQPRRTLMEGEIFRNIPYSQVFTDEMERAQVVYYAEDSAELQELVREAVESVMYGRATPEKAYVRLRTFAQAIIDDRS